MRIKGGVFFFCLILLSCTFSQSDSVRSVYDYSLIELIGLKVSLATKEQQDQLEAPGQITVYNREFIGDYGFNTLAELSQVTSGYGSFNVYGEGVFETRGRRDFSFNNNKHLVLYDGIPMNFARNFKAPMDFEMPLFFAQRVEFLRGPGSALYGASAFYGVIEYSPEQSQGESVFRKRAGFSSEQGGNYYQAKFAGPFKYGKGAVMASYFQQNASQSFLGADSLVLSNDFRYYDNQRSIFLASKTSLDKGYLQGVDIGMVMMSRSTGIGEFWGGPSSELNQLSWTSIIPYLKYKKALSDKVQVSTWLKYNKSIERGAFETNNVFTLDNLGQQIVFQNGVLVPLNIYQQYQRTVENYEGQLEFGLKRNVNDDYKIGVNYNGRKQKNDQSYSRLFFTPDSTNSSSVELGELNEQPWYHILSVYGQYRKSLDVLESLDFTLGARQDIGVSSSNVFRRLSPRIGVVQKVTNKLALKFLYGTALRTPGMKEVGANQDASDLGVDTRLLSDLSAEVVKTTELSLAYQNQTQHFSLVFFNSEVGNEITALSANNAVPYYVNSDTITEMRGVEIDYTRVLSTGLLLKSNFTTSRSKDYFSDLFGTTRFRWNTMLAYKPQVKFSPRLALVNRWRSGYILGVDRGADSFSFLDVTASGSLQNVTLRLQIRNVLNKLVKQPGNLSGMAGSLGRYDIPLNGRVVWLSLEIGD